MDRLVLYSGIFFQNLIYLFLISTVYILFLRIIDNNINRYLHASFEFKFAFPSSSFRGILMEIATSADETDFICTHFRWLDRRIAAVIHGG